jgi:diaminopimelate decarboxylase
MYAGTNTRSTERFTACIDRLVDAALTLPHLEYIDVGGGFGVPYKDSEKPLDVPAVAAHIRSRMPRGIRLVVEPGRILVASAGSLLMRVVSVKERAGRRYVGVDSTVANVAVESVYHAFHRVDALVQNPQQCEIPTDICGNTTHSRDFIARGRTLPHLQPGDLLALRDVGAYGYAMSSHFLNRPRPAEVVLDNGEIHLTTRRETLDDLLAATL